MYVTRTSPSDVRMYVSLQTLIICKSAVKVKQKLGAKWRFTDKVLTCSQKWPPSISCLLCAYSLKALQSTCLCRKETLYDNKQSALVRLCQHIKLKTTPFQNIYRILINILWIQLISGYHPNLSGVVSDIIGLQRSVDAQSPTWLASTADIRGHQPH